MKGWLYALETSATFPINLLSEKKIHYNLDLDV